MSCFLLKIEQFQFPSFCRAWHQEDGRDRAFPSLKNDRRRVIFSILNNLSLRRNINLNIRKFTRVNKHLFWQKWTPDVFSYFRPPCLCPSEGHKHGVSMNLCGTFCQITWVWNAAQTWHLDRCLIYLSSIPCQFLDFIHGMVSIFFSMAWQWKPRIAWQKARFSCLCEVFVEGPVFYSQKSLLREFSALDFFG